MKVKPLAIAFLACYGILCLQSQPYSSTDSLALLAADLSCDAANLLNWNTEPDPGKWEGVNWNTDNPRRVTKLIISGRSLTGTLDLNALSGMDFLECSSNELTGLEVSNLLNLTYLSCFNNQLTSLDVSALAALNNLTCSTNQISSLNVSNLLKLTHLGCSINQLTTLDVSDLVNLTYLACNLNQIEELDVSDLTVLKELYCQANHIAVLDVSALTALEVLSCNSNQITTLDVEELIHLRSFYCADNHLDYLNLAALGDLKVLTCENNNLPFSILAAGLLVEEFTYAPQGVVFEGSTFTENTTLDYASEAMISGSSTQFVFYKDWNEVETNSTGLYTTSGNGTYFCTMTNPEFPGLTITTASKVVTNVTDIRAGEPTWIGIYPNPTDGPLSIISKAGQMRQVRFEVFDARGIPVIESFNPGIQEGKNEILLDLSRLKAGQYLLKIDMGEQLFYERIVVL